MLTVVLVHFILVAAAVAFVLFLFGALLNYMPDSMAGPILGIGAAGAVVWALLKMGVL